MSTNNTPRNPLTLPAVKRWLAVSIGGAFLTVVGLIWDAVQHGADPSLAATEGPLTLSNPSHSLTAIGLAAVGIGLAGSAWSVWRPASGTTWAKVGAVAAGAAVVLAVGAGAWATTSGNENHHGAAVAAGDIHEHSEGEMAGGSDRAAAHEHSAMAPYGERYAEATEAERQAADDLLAATQQSLARYADAQDALDAGYVAPRSPQGPMWHYRLPGASYDGNALDPEVPEGLVYYTPEDGSTPSLAGAFFVVPPGAEVPMPAGNLVVWHSHGCESFWVTPEQLCEDHAKMLHVWSFEETTRVSPRSDRPVTIEVVDPFGAPFGASIAVVP